MAGVVEGVDGEEGAEAELGSRAYLEQSLTASYFLRRSMAMCLKEPWLSN